MHPIKIPIHPSKDHLGNHQDCRVRMLGGTDIVECKTEMVKCKWARHFRDGQICKHPSAKQFVISSQEDGNSKSTVINDRNSTSTPSPSPS